MRRVWMDVDCGVDDGQALALLALAQRRSLVEVVGVSAVAGNVCLDSVLVNTERVMKACGLDRALLHRGAAEPMLGQAMDFTDFHGADGLGDVPTQLPLPSASAAEVQVSGRHAALALAEAAARCAADGGAKLSLIAVGPLTNVALALQLEPRLPALLECFAAMGGTDSADGNAGDGAAEYNFFIDPEAAHLALSKMPSTKVVTWECTMRHRIPWAQMERWAAADTPRAQFFSAICEQSVARVKSNTQAQSGEEGWVACDPLALACVLWPEIVQKCEERHCEIELQGARTRGMSVIDRRPWGGGEKNVSIVSEIDTAAFCVLMEAAMAEDE